MRALPGDGMTRIRILAILVTALTAGGGLAAGTYRYLQNVPVREISVPTRPVVVATANLPLAAELKANDLVVVDWPVDSVPEGVFPSENELVGRGLIDSVVKYEPILAAKLAPEGAGVGLPPVISPGMRALSVRVNDVVGVAGYVLPGTYVDVVATASPSNRPQEMTSKIVLSNVRVLTAGTRLEQDTEDGKPLQVTVVTLMVTPAQAERLTLASNEGKIQLALRNPLDQGTPATPGIRPGTLLAATRPARARPRRAPRRVSLTVEVIRGIEREEVVVTGGIE